MRLPDVSVPLTTLSVYCVAAASPPVGDTVAVLKSAEKPTVNGTGVDVFVVTRVMSPGETVGSSVSGFMALLN